MFDILSEDALAGVDQLKKHAEIDTARIGLMGWSQAGWIIPLAASKSDDIRFMINVVGPTISIGQEIYYSTLTGDSGSGPLPGGRTWEEVYTLTRNFSGNDGFDPIVVLQNVSIPGLWVLGEKDRSIPTPLVVEDLDVLASMHGKDYTYRVYPNANHGIRNVDTGVQYPYIMEPGGVVDWIRSKTRSTSAL